MITLPKPFQKEHSSTPTPRSGRLRRLSRKGGLALVILVIVGAGVQSILEWNDARQHPAPGEFVTLADGRQFHYQLTGTNHDGPLVILEAGGGSFSPQWARVQEQVAEFTQVLSYDRAGMGWSEGATNVGQQPDAPTTDLYDLLAALDLDGPYLFVGHSYGAVFARMHAHAAPKDVLGVVLVDPAHEEQFQRIPAMANQAQLTVMPHLARIGLLRMLTPFDELGEGMPERAFAPWRAVSYTTRHAAAFRDEGRFVRDVVSPWFLTQDIDLGDVPVRVFPADDAVWPDPEVRTMQEELLELSTDSQWSGLPGDHFSILTLPQSTQVIAATIRELAAAPTQSN